MLLACKKHGWLWELQQEGDGWCDCPRAAQQPAQHDVAHCIVTPQQLLQQPEVSLYLAPLLGTCTA